MPGCISVYLDFHRFVEVVLDLSAMKTSESTYDVVIIGAGIMSATLGTFLKELEPNLKMAIFEKT